MTSKFSPLAITMGDPAGIGLEITAKTWRDLRGNPDFTFALLAPKEAIDPVLIQAGAPPSQLIEDISHAVEVFQDHLPVLNIDTYISAPGKPDVKTADGIIGSIKHAVTLALSGDAAGVVTNPIAKDVLYKAGFEFPGHTEFLGALTEHRHVAGARGPVMMLEGGGLRAALATVHLPLIEAAKILSTETIIHKAKVMHFALERDFGITNPRIALTGLNPHAGEGGALGREEIEIINPAAQVLRSEGINVTDAQPADTLFHAEARMGYDAVLAMYHDQGLIPVKTLDFHGGVNITLGLPIVRTSPDHGTAFGIAGQGLARPDSLIAAIKTARTLANNRARYVT